MQGKSGSAIKYITAVSPGASLVAASQATGPSNFTGYEWATVIVSLGCPPNTAGGGLIVNLQRSGTSNGTFANWGASLPGQSTGSRQTGVRSFALTSSATWYRVQYESNSGNWNGAILVALSHARSHPIPTQDTHTTVSSDVTQG